MSDQDQQSSDLQKRQVEATERLAETLSAINKQLVSLNHNVAAACRAITARR